MNPKVSILVPIYNVSPYIEKCAISLLNQTFADIEFIFVNDATTDDSIEKLSAVLEQFPERKDRVRIIHHSINKGLAAARNTAINASKGEFISVVDSDDYIDSQMIETLYAKAVNENADIVVSDMFIESKDKTITFTDFLSANDQEHFTNIIVNEFTSHSLCNKLVSSKLYKHPECRVPEGLNYLEDRHVMIRLFYFSKKIVKVDQAFYHYVQYNGNSITKNKGRMHFENVILFWNLLDAFLKEHNEYEKYRQVMELPKVENKVQLMVETHSCQLRKEFANMFRDEETNYLSHFKRGKKIMLLLIRYKMFGLAQLFHNLLVIKNRKLSR